MSRVRAALGLLVVVITVLLQPTVARAHEQKPALLRLDEAADGTIALQWSPPVTGTDAETRVFPRFPEHCQARAGILECGEDGLVGEIVIDGLAGSGADVVVQITRADGTAQTEVLRGSRDRMLLGAADARASLQLFLAYLGIGVEHILLGLDHLLFVVGLLLLVGFRHELLWTITAFTVAHSITLALSVLGVVHLSQGPVEVVIALSIVLVAWEASRPDVQSLSRTRPWLVSFGFGLLHGFGFSGALREIGLPPTQLPLTLAAFNIGVEIGQLAVVLVAVVIFYLGVRALERRPEKSMQGLRVARGAALHAMGGLAAFWTLDRIAGLLGLGSGDGL